MGESTGILIFKKAFPSDCGDQKGVSSNSASSKILPSIRLRNLCNIHKRENLENQEGFHAGRECVHQIFILQLVYEHRSTFQRPAINVFLNIHTDLDFFDRFALRHCTLQNRIPEEYVLYSHTWGCFGALWPSLTIIRRFQWSRQDCPISPFLLNYHGGCST